ncbi:MAG: type IV toxin-antitoxin system AbiEi family antitoxin domain-containing protein [Dehalococcoidia bacterium]
MSSSDSILAALAAVQHGIFTLQQAREAGLSPRQIARRLEDGRWTKVHEFAYRFAGAPTTWEGTLLAACWAGGIRAVASHRSAARLWNLPGGRDDLAEITCPRWRRARHDGIIVHETKRFDACDRVVVRSIPSASAERALLGLAGVCRPSVVELALENGLRRELFTIESLQAIVRRLGRRGRNGVGVLRALIGERDPHAAPPDSEMETRVIQMLRRNGLPRPVTQLDIFDGSRFVARVDFAYPQWMVCMEYESYQEHTGNLALERDNPRRNALVSLGWKPIGITPKDIRSGGLRVAQQILNVSRRSRRISKPFGVDS